MLRRGRRQIAGAVCGGTCSFPARHGRRGGMRYVLTPGLEATMPWMLPSHIPSLACLFVLGRGCAWRISCVCIAELYRSQLDVHQPCGEMDLQTFVKPAYALRIDLAVLFLVSLGHPVEGDANFVLVDLVIVVSECSCLCDREVEVMLGAELMSVPGEVYVQGWHENSFRGVQLHSPEPVILLEKPCHGELRGWAV